MSQSFIVRFIQHQVTGSSDRKNAFSTRVGGRYEADSEPTRVHTNGPRARTRISVHSYAPMPTFGALLPHNSGNSRPVVPERLTMKLIPLMPNPARAESWTSLGSRAVSVTETEKNSWAVWPTWHPKVAPFSAVRQVGVPGKAAAN